MKSQNRSPELESGPDATGLEDALQIVSPAQAWFRDAMTAIEALAASGELFTADDLSALLERPTSPHQVSAAFAVMRRKRKITAVGATVGRGGWLLYVWRGSGS
jgi:hypothetical protein